MRTYRLALFTILIGCKAAVPTTDSNNIYKEDLSVLRADVSEQKVSNDTAKKEIVEEYVPLTGHIKAELDSIASISLEQNKKGKMVDGFVILVYSGNDRDEANNIRNQMYQNFSDLKPKVSYHQPSFRVKAGQFEDRLEGTRICAEVKKEFSRALLVPERFRVIYE
ncbi:MAG: SPOR domain-containing protein [Ekhidna sp.]